MWISDKSTSTSPRHKPGSFPREQARPGPASLAVLCASAGWMLPRSQPEKYPFSLLPFDRAASGNLDLGLAAHIQAMDSSGPVASSFRAPFGRCWAERSWRLAGDAGGLVIHSPGNSWRPMASSSVTKTGMMWTFGGSATPHSCRTSPPVGLLWSRGVAR